MPRSEIKQSGTWFAANRVAEACQRAIDNLLAERQKIRQREIQTLLDKPARWWRAKYTQEQAEKEVDGDEFASFYFVYGSQIERLENLRDISLASDAYAGAVVFVSVDDFPDIRQFMQD